MPWLPQGLQQAFRQEMANFEEELKMRYVTSNERLAKAEGVEEGILQGLRQGIQQGREHGRVEGKAQVLLRLLSQRFGPSPDWLKRKIEAASEQELELWTDALLTARSLDEVLLSGQKN